MVKSDSTLTEYASNVGQSITNSINSALDTMGHSYSWLKGMYLHENQIYLYIQTICSIINKFTC